jgi:hypothetical protein
MKEANPMPDANKVSMAFTPADWQLMLNAVAQRPYFEVHALIADMQAQFASSTVPSGEPEATKE